jgi:hypothetical protein
MAFGLFPCVASRLELKCFEERTVAEMPIGEGFDLPPGAEPWSDFHWFQPSTKGILVVVMLSERPIWYTGHYVGGRMAPCCGSGCDYCATGISAQVRYVVACAESSTRRVGLIEFGRANGLLIRDWINRQGTMRGMVLEISKHSKNVQSRTEIRYIETPCDPWYLTLQVPDCSTALFLTWHKAGMKMPEELVESSRRKLEMRRLAVEERERDRGKFW